MLVLLLLHYALVVRPCALDHGHGQAADAAECHLQKSSPLSVNTAGFVELSFHDALNVCLDHACIPIQYHSDSTQAQRQ